MAVLGVALAALAVTESAKGDTSTVSGLVFLVVFYLVSLPLLGSLALLTFLHGFRRGFRPVLWICAYLLVASIVHVVIVERIGGFDKLQRRLANWQRSYEMPAQVAFERAIAPPTDIAAVRAALEAGANPRAILPGVPLTPLFTAALKGDEELTTVLLEAGADPNRRADVDGAFGGAEITKPYPMDAAAFSDSSERRDVVQQLLAFGAVASGSHAHLGACAQNDLALYEITLAAGASDVPDNNGNSCLHFAARHNSTDIAIRAIAAGADPNKANVANQRPLDIAFVWSSFDTALEIARAGGVPEDWSRTDRMMNEEAMDPVKAELQEWISTNRR